MPSPRELIDLLNRAEALLARGENATPILLQTIAKFGHVTADDTPEGRRWRKLTNDEAQARFKQDFESMKDDLPGPLPPFAIPSSSAPAFAVVGPPTEMRSVTRTLPLEGKALRRGERQWFTLRPLDVFRPERLFFPSHVANLVEVFEVRIGTRGLLERGMDQWDPVFGFHPVDGALFDQAIPVGEAYKPDFSTVQIGQDFAVLVGVKPNVLTHMDVLIVTPFAEGKTPFSPSYAEAAE